MPDRNYSENEMDLAIRLERIDANVTAILKQTTITNGRVTAIETWKDRIDHDIDVRNGEELQREKINKIVLGVLFLFITGAVSVITGITLHLVGAS